MDEVRIVVGGSMEEDLAEFVRVYEAAERGAAVPASGRVLAFDDWETLAGVLTGERHRLLRHLNAHPEPSVSALARALGRQYRRVHADVAALEAVGLVDRTTGPVRATADRLTAEIALT